MGKGAGKGGLVKYDPNSWLGLRCIFQAEGSVIGSATPTAILIGCICAGIWLSPYVDVDEKDKRTVVYSGEKGKSITFAYGLVSLGLAYFMVTGIGTAYLRFWQGRTWLAMFDARVMELAMLVTIFGKKESSMTVLGVQHECDVNVHEEISRLLRVYVGLAFTSLQEDPSEMWSPPGERPWDPSEYGVNVLLTRAETEALQASDNRVLTCMSWIMDFFCTYDGKGHWAVPPPCRTRFTQMISDVNLAYNSCCAIADSTIPFPIIHTRLTLLVVYAVSWAFLVALLSNSAWWAFVVAFVPMFAFYGVKTVADELQDPFGDDANDLPLPELHASMCRNLRIMLEPWNFDFEGNAAARGVHGPQAWFPESLDGQSLHDDHGEVG